MSHHSSKPDEEMSDFMKDMLNEITPETIENLTRPINLGPTGKFPDGKLTEADEGEIEFSIFGKDGKVVIEFGSPVHWVGMTPPQAAAVAEALLKHARKQAVEPIRFNIS